MLHNIFLAESDFPALNVVNFGYEDCEKSHHFGPAVRTYWLLHFVESGFGTYNIEGNTYTLKPGEVFVIPPYVETYYQADAQNPWRYTWVGFTCNGKLPLDLPHVIKCPAALEIFERMKKCDSIIGGKNAFLVARVWELFSLLLEKEQKEPDYIEIALGAIHSEYMSELNASTLAERLSLDRSYFTTLFKEKVGVSPGRYIFTHRMTTAASFMLSGQSVTTAANSVGYNDIYNFSRMFKRHFGIPPREYIKKYRDDAKI
ncbi:MAG: AraC family transcriptional regulator [Clostridia bacterium]|nr:AraC family transcriptional regulator [Clostridia bacterium]